MSLRRRRLTELCRTLGRYKLRTFLMSLGVVVGVATLVAARSYGAGAERAMMDKVEKMFSASSLVVMSGGPTSLKMEDIEAVVQELDQVVDWVPAQIMPGQTVQFEGNQRTVTIHGYSERAEAVWHRGVSHGEFFTAADVTSTARVALLGSRTALALFGDRDPIGEQIRIASVPFRVVGVLEDIGLDPHGMDRDDEVQVPITTLMRRLRNVDHISYAKLQVADPEDVDSTAEEVAEILRRRHVIQEGEEDDFRIFTPEFVQQMVARGQRVLKVFIPAGAGLILLLATLVIANIMWISVRDRQVEIGLRKSLGATDRQVGRQFLAEALLVTLASGFVGTLLGLGIVWWASRAMALPPIISPPAALWGLSSALLVGVLAGYLPARRAARLDPVRSLG